MSAKAIQEIKILFRKGAKRLNKFFYVGVVIGIVMGPLVLLLAFVPGAAEALRIPADQRPYMIGFGAMMTLLFIVALVEQYVKFRKDTALIRLIEHNPEEIVWAHKSIGEARVSQSYASPGASVARFVHAHFYLLDGSKNLVWLSEAETDRLLHLVHTTFPHISCGYTDAIKQAYKRDPAALLRNPQYSEAAEKRASTAKI